MSRTIETGNGLQIGKAPNYAYLDVHKILHVWNEKPEAINAQTAKDPKCLQVNIDSFMGYPCFGGSYEVAGIDENGNIYGCDEFPQLSPVIRELARLEGYDVSN